MDAVRLAIWGAALLAIGAAAMGAGILPVDVALALGDRVWPVLAFVVSMTVVAELATAAGLFDVVASWLARISRGRTWMLWLLVVALAVATTAFLSLDTTAVLLTPVVVVVARANGLPALPFALVTVWLANTASLVLPVSNLTNLLSLHVLGFDDAASFLALLSPSAAIAIGVPVAVGAVLFRRELRGRFHPAPLARATDTALLRITGVVVLALLPFLVIGVPPWMPTSIAAVILVALFAWRAPRAVHPRLLPWQLIVFVTGLFLTVGAVESAGLSVWLASITGSGDDPVALLRMAASGLIGANVVNNLPAYLALEPVADSSSRVAALLIGVNAGPLITPWASLATLLWHARLTAMGVELRWRTFVLWGLVVAPVTVGLAVVPLLVR